MRVLVFVCLIFYSIVTSTLLHANNYTLSSEKALYVPIMMDDITTMISLRPSELISPANGSTINGTLHMKFSKGSGVEKRLLKVYYANHTRQALSTWITSDSYSVSLPKDGKYIDVELRSYIVDKYFIKKYSFKQSTDPSVIVSHPNRAYLDSGAITLRWSTGTNITQRYMKIGTSGYGSSDIYKGILSGNSKTFYNLPRNGETIYVMFGSMIDGKWIHRYYTYTATDVMRIATSFVQAYLARDNTKMKKIIYADSLQALKNIDAKVRNAFSKIVSSSYKKSIYFHGYKASVTVRSSVTSSKTVELKFIFSWVVNRWVLERVI